MNIIVIGSCKDSSTLAKELNRRLKNSIVARIDLLKNIKQLVLQGLNVNTTENLGTYVGDVESYDFARIPAHQRAKIVAAVESINSNINALRSTSTRTEAHIGNTFDALTNGIPTSTYSFIKVYSGAIDDERVTKMLNDSAFIPNAIVVTVKTPSDLLFPITVSEKLVKLMKEKAFAAVECESIDQVYKTEIFRMLFELTEEKDVPVETPETKGHAVPVPGVLNAVHADILEEEFGMGMAA